MSDVPEQDWYGIPVSVVEHRTVGPHRAWCYSDSEWCYPDNLCWCCDQSGVPQRWRGDHVGAVLADLRARVKMLDQFPWVDGPERRLMVLIDDVLDLIGGSDE